jgi:ABC-type transport system involved in multi-copper enzyme maturation permease subunit
LTETVTPGFLKRLLMNPLAARELRVACRSWKLVVVLTAYLLIQSAIFAIFVYVRSESSGVYINPTATGSLLFTVLSVVMVVVVMLVFPAFSSTAIASEHERKSFDLLLLTPLAPWEIATGKFFAAAIQAGIFLVATVPLFAMAGLFGGIDSAVFFVILWILVLLSLLISFVGVYASSLVSRSIPAVLVTYVLAMLLGILLLIVFITLRTASGLIASFPLVSFLTDPTLKEGIFYVTVLTLACATYCTFLFFSTTNRLKPTSHNKSTNLRVFWTLVAIIVPLKLAAYFLLVRVPPFGMAVAVMLVAVVYLTLLMLIPSVTAPAEPPLPSRRVRREMERVPQGLMRAGGVLFFPGGPRGAAHSSIIIVLAMSLMALSILFGYSRMEAQISDPAELISTYAMATQTVSPSESIDSIRAKVSTLLSHESRGLLLMLVALAVTLLVVSQLAWRLSFTGMTRTLTSVMAALLLGIWIAAPFMAEMFTGEQRENRLASQFSPVQAAIDGAAVGMLNGRAAIESDVPRAERLTAEASQARRRWWTFIATSAAAGIVLLVLNIASQRRVMRMVSQAASAAEQRHEQPPAAVSVKALEEALQHVQQEQPPPQS